MRKLLTLLLAALFLFGTLATSYALSLTFDVAPSFSNPTTTNWFNGITSSPTGNYATVYTPPFVDPFDVTVPSNIGLGFAVQTALNPAGPAETFNYNSGAPATPTSALLNFYLYPTGNPGVAHQFLVEGTITGTMTGTNSNTYFTFTGFRDVTAGILYSGTQMVGGNTYIVGMPVIGGNVFTLGILKSALLSPPSNPAGNSIQGFVDVPEPGTLAMLFGSGVSASLMFLRRRRA